MKKLFLPLALIASILFSSLIAVNPATADSFVPLPDPPTQKVMVAPNNFQPAYPRSLANYTLKVTVGSAATVQALSRVSMCWYKDTYDDFCLQGGTPNSNPDPRYYFFMSWFNYNQLDYAGSAPDSSDPSTWFSIVGNNSYQDVGSAVVYDGEKDTMDLEFKFKVSRSMAQGSDWHVIVRVYDVFDQFTDQLEDGKTVLYFGNVFEPTDQYNYLEMMRGNQSFKEDWNDAYSFYSNGNSKITYSATDFVYYSPTGPSSIPVVGGAPNTDPGVGQVTLDCNPGSYFDQNYSIRITAQPTVVRSSVFSGSDIIGEAGSDGNLYHSCRLKYGGGAALTNVQYENIFTVGIGPA